MATYNGSQRGLLGRWLSLAGASGAASLQRSMPSVPAYQGQRREASGVLQGGGLDG